MLSSTVCPAITSTLLCDLVGFPFLFLRDITPQVMLCPMAEVMRLSNFGVEILKGRSIQELAVDRWKFIADNRVCQKSSFRYRIFQMKAKWSITAEQHRALLTYFVQDHSDACPDYHPISSLVTERFPPFLITLLLFSCRRTEVLVGTRQTGFPFPHSPYSLLRCTTRDKMNQGMYPQSPGNINIEVVQTGKSEYETI